MKKEITFAYVHILHPHELVIKSAASYWGISEEDLLGSKQKSNRETTTRKSIVFYILKNDCKMTDIEIASIAGVSRQHVAYLLDRVDLRERLYLTNTCHYNNIKHIFSTLLKEQKEWLEQHSL